LEKILASMKKA